MGLHRAPRGEEADAGQRGDGEQGKEPVAGRAVGHQSGGVRPTSREDAHEDQTPDGGKCGQWSHRILGLLLRFLLGLLGGLGGTLVGGALAVQVDLGQVQLGGRLWRLDRLLHRGGGRRRRGLLG